MPRKKANSVQLRLNVPAVAAERLERLADALATSVPDLLRFMVSTSLVQWETMYLHPEKVTAIDDASLPAEARSVIDDMDRDTLELAPDLVDQKKLGFGPRGQLGAWVPSSGYMAGL